MSGKNRNYSTDYGAWHDGVPRGAFAWDSAQSVVAETECKNGIA
ncbi:hypothetical protein RCT64_02975 [Escherichia coli]|nr:hypothetical protein [Escherichia coli]MED0552585.1 hypothetical protein [Escherichia coli]MED9025255.1 hypothetical protein [Escherichia coli]MED9078550.1 hypothetical protein [Escherichia coli]MED9318698.1 hypothetical protein [Escherichia coli]